MTHGFCVEALLPAALALVALSSMALSAAEGGLDEERIEAVAALLAEKPAGFGRPITDRSAWEQLAKHKSYRGLIPRAEKLLTEPIPDQPDDLYLDFSRTGNRTRWQKVCGLLS